MKTPTTPSSSPHARPSIETLAGLYLAAADMRAAALRATVTAIDLAERHGFTEKQIVEFCDQVHARPISAQ